MVYFDKGLGPKANLPSLGSTCARISWLARDLSPDEIMSAIESIDLSSFTRQSIGDYYKSLMMAIEAAVMVAEEQGEFDDGIDAGVDAVVAAEEAELAEEFGPDTDNDDSDVE